MLGKIKKHIITGIIITLLIYLGISVIIDSDSVINAFQNFNLSLLPFIIVLILLNYFTRFLKWHYYLSLIDCNLSFKYSFLVFMSGLAMSATPGKAGELVKSYILKKDHNFQIRITAPVVFAERYTDMVSLILLALAAGLLLQQDLLLIAVIGIAFLLLLLLLLNKYFNNVLIKLFKKIPIADKYSEYLADSLRSSSILLSGMPLIKMSLLSLLSWFFECLALFVVVDIFIEPFSVFSSTFSYSVSMILGSLSFLPGGLGVTDGSLAYMLSQDGLPFNSAIAATFIFRVLTLWFSVALGVAFLIIYQNKYGKIKEDI